MSEGRLLKSVFKCDQFNNTAWINTRHESFLCCNIWYLFFSCLNKQFLNDNNNYSENAFFSEGLPWNVAEVFGCCCFCCLLNRCRNWRNARCSRTSVMRGFWAILLRRVWLISAILLVLEGKQILLVDYLESVRAPKTSNRLC